MDAASGSATGLGIERRLYSDDAKVLASVTIHNTNAIAARPKQKLCPNSARISAAVRYGPLGLGRAIFFERRRRGFDGI
jgi:hypothetical protein